MSDQSDLFVPNKLLRIISMTATMTANKAAHQKPWTVNLSLIKELVSITINTVTINETKPKVNRFSGKVNTRKIVPRVALTKPITKPARMAQPKLSTDTAESGKIQDAKKIANPLSNVSMMNLIMLRIKVYDKVTVKIRVLF